MSEVQPLELAIEHWDRDAVAEQLVEADQLRTMFTDRFPLDQWPTMPLERYALGQDQESEPYSWWLEWKTRPVGSIRGGSSRKHLIWMGKGGWRFPKEYDNVQQAWEEVRAGFVEAFRLASEERFGEITSLPAIPKASAVLCKSLYLYFPDRFLPVFSRDHINHFLTLLGDEGTRWATIDANRRLTEVVESMPAFQGMSHQEIMYFLYGWSHPSPSRNVFKIAPGHQASKWDDCLPNGYICVGWDEIGDLTQYTDRDEVKQAMLDLGFL